MVYGDIYGNIQIQATHCKGVNGNITTSGLTIHNVSKAFPDMAKKNEPDNSLNTFAGRFALCHISATGYDFPPAYPKDPKTHYELFDNI